MKRGLAYIKSKYGDPYVIIPPMVNELGQARTAERLGVSAFTINRWLRINGYVKRIRIQYVRVESEKLPHG